MVYVILRYLGNDLHILRKSQVTLSIREAVVGLLTFKNSLQSNIYTVLFRVSEHSCMYQGGKFFSAP